MFLVYLEHYQVFIRLTVQIANHPKQLIDGLR
jgi:hypothetical protein